MRVLSEGELSQIASTIQTDLSEMLNRYEHDKYPLAVYSSFQEKFASTQVNFSVIREALTWKWGHFNKSAYPNAHRRLIRRISRAWPQFERSAARSDGAATFEWWRNRLAPTRPYVTSAFLAHLVHGAPQVPIIDRHNFRGMNILIRSVDHAHFVPKRPGSWAHIQELKAFQLAIAPRLNLVDAGDLDRFLMMYGKYRGRRPVSRCESGEIRLF